MTPRKTLYGQYAGFITRLVAFVVDLIAITLGAALFAAITRLVLGFFRFDEFTDALSLLVLGGSQVLFAGGYFVAFWVLAGQTPGMSMTGVRVVRTNGKPVGIGTAILRFIAYAISAILFLGFIWILFDKRRQGWHDKIARTYVIYAWDARSANLIAMARRLRASNAVLPPPQR